MGKKNKLYGKMIHARIKNDQIYLKYRIDNKILEKYTLNNFCLIYREDKAFPKKTYKYPIEYIRKTAKYTYMKSRIDILSVDFKSIYWDFKIHAVSDEKEQYISLKNKGYFNYAKYCSIFYPNEYNYNNGMFLFPYVAADRHISLQYREKGPYDGIIFKLKERIALLRYIFTYPWLKYKKIFLIFEKFSYMAQDNGYYMFQYCMNNNMEKELKRSIYYVIDKESPDYEKMLPYKKNVIPFMSIRHITYALAARLFISTDAKAHIYPWRRKGSALIPLIKRKRHVFLQHGVTALKKVHFFYGKKKGGRCDMFVTTSEFEQNIVLEYFNYNITEIPITGFARWDVLEDKSQNRKEILIVPTWRSWLENKSKEEFLQSLYFKKYMEVLQSEELHKMLELYQVNINFYIHTKFRMYLKEFNINNQNINTISFGEVPLNELLMNCNMMITDYSSVCWDSYYLKKPVAFYQFDTEDYMQYHGSYIDLEHDLFGDRTDNIDDLLAIIEKNILNGFKLNEEWSKKHGKYFKYCDKNNSKRICEEIRDRKW